MNSFMIMIIHDSKASNYDSYKRSSGLNVKYHTIGVILYESYMDKNIHSDFIIMIYCRN